MNPSVDSVIAERQLTLKSDSTPDKEVRVVVGKPTQSEDRDYYCQVQIVGLADENVRSIYGLDSMQALQLALRFISTQLEEHRNVLYWVGDKDIGF
jgi:hypothetical protein